MKQDLILRLSLKKTWEGLKEKGLFLGFITYEDWEKRNEPKEEKPVKKKV